jgi:indole-3-glycerol phosphate synthase
VILDEILASKRREVTLASAVRPLRQVEREAADAPPARDFTGALRAPGLSVIAEIKRKSPSGGLLRPDLGPADLAQEYDAHGARALSVLTDEPFFGGTLDDLRSARAACRLPALRKDFVVDPYQVFEARAAGADAILLIVRALSAATLSELLGLAQDVGLAVLVETHTGDEVHRALAAGARIVGVNNRDLDTLVTDPTLALRLRALVPPETLIVAESGLNTPEHAAACAREGIDAILVGEALLRAPHPGEALDRLVEAGAATRAAR